MAFICELMFVYLCFMCFGLVLDLIWFLIKSQSFRLLIHLVSSPNDVATLLFVLIRWVVFVVVFQDEFSTICQSFIVFVVREGVIVHPKMDSNSEFGCPYKAEERERCAREFARPKAKQGGHVWTTCATRPESLSAPVWNTCPTRGHG